LALFIPLSGFGLGTRIPNQGAEAIGRGNAFVATADDPTAIYYNPAGITQLEGQHFQAGALLYFDINDNYISPSGQRYNNQVSTIPVPQFDYTVSLKNLPISLGLGLYMPFGFKSEWPDNAPFKDAGLQAELDYLTVNPVLAWRPLTNLSLAIGPTFNYSDLSLREGVAGLPPPAQYRFDGNDAAYGFSAGVLWRPFERWSLGAKYFSATSFNYGGSSAFSPALPELPSGHTTTSLDFPQMVAAGISFRPTTNWNVEVDIDWTDWNRTQNLTIQGITSVPLNWQSSFFYEAGVTRQLGRGYYASAGYFFCEASTPSQYYTPLVPDTDLHVGSLGVGRKARHWDWAAALQIIGGAYRTVSGDVTPSADGRYRLITPTLSVSVGYHF
jgi:long-chain fatty acid transport protein